MPIINNRFITYEEFKSWDEIDPILQNEQTYQEGYVNQAVARASQMINKYANKKGENYLRIGFKDNTLPDDIKEQIKLATCIQTQYYLINSTQYENTDGHQSQGSINYQQQADNNYFLVPEVMDILISLDLAFNHSANDMDKFAGGDKRRNGRWNPWTGEYDPLLDLSTADARYLQKSKQLSSKDNTININPNPGIDTTIDLSVNADILAQNPKFKGEKGDKGDKGDPGDIGNLATINNKPLDKGGNIDLQVPITTRTTDIVFDSTETNRLQWSTNRINELDSKVNQTTLDGMFKSNGNYLEYQKTDWLNMNDKIITGLHEPNTTTDAVNLKYLNRMFKLNESNDLIVDLNGQWLDMMEKSIWNLEDPTLEHQATNKRYVDSQTIGLKWVAVDNNITNNRVILNNLDAAKNYRFNGMLGVSNGDKTTYINANWLIIGGIGANVPIVLGSGLLVDDPTISFAFEYQITSNQFSLGLLSSKALLIFSADKLYAQEIQYVITTTIGSN